MTTLAEIGLPGKARKVRHRHLTAEQWAKLEHEADLRAQITAQKTLATEMGVTQSYICNILRRLVEERRGNVPRLAHKFALDEREAESGV